jgi:hypothetical protein
MDAEKDHRAPAAVRSAPLNVSVQGLYGLALQMFSTAASQWRALLPLLLILFGLYTAATMALVALSAATGTPLALLTRDVAATLGAKFYIGLLSSIGALLWCAAATTCFAGAAVLRRFPGERERECAAFLLGSGALLTALGLDDFFMLHEVVYPRLGLREGVLVVFYALGLLALTLRYRAVLLGSDILLWVIGCLLFVASVLVDGFVSDATAFEDIPKVAGVCTWLCYYWRLVMARLDTQVTSHG